MHLQTVIFFNYEVIEQTNFMLHISNRFTLLLLGIASTTVGRDFIFGFINNFIGKDEAQLFALVSNANDQSTTVIVTSIYSSFQTINVIIPPNTVETVKT